MEPVVSVITPCRNGREFLAETVASVVGQPLRPVELIIVDDGSTDGSAELAEELARAHPEVVRAVRQPAANGNVARNTGAREARAALLYFLDADDMLAPGALALLAGAAAENPGSVILGGYDYLHPESGGWRRQGIAVPSASDIKGWMRLLAANRWHLATGIALWPRGVFDRIGGWDETVLAAQDKDLFLRAVRGGEPMAWIPEPVLLYRRHGETRKSVSTTFDDSAHFESRLRITDLMAEVAAEMGLAREITRDLGRRYHALALRHSAADPALVERSLRRAVELAGWEGLHLSRANRLILRYGGYSAWRAASRLASQLRLDAEGRSARRASARSGA